MPTYSDENDVLKLGICDAEVAEVNCPLEHLKHNLAFLTDGHDSFLNAIPLRLSTFRKLLLYAMLRQNQNVNCSRQKQLPCHM
jgi:hypothetical protein